MDRLLYSLLACFAILAPATLLANGVRIETFFHPSTINLANTSTYKIVIKGSQQGPVGALPAVNGLSFSSTPRTLKSTSVINGTPSISYELSFTVTPEKVGSFIVPPWQLKVENIAYEAPQAKLDVLPPSQQDKIREEKIRQEQNDLRQAAFLEFSCARPFLYEGETAEASVKLFIWDRLPVTGLEHLPTKNGSGFSMTALGQPTQQTNVKRVNKNYSVYSWDFGLTAALAGTHSIGFDTMVRVRVKNSRKSPFNSPFFNDPFFGFGREEGLKITSVSTPLEVRPLPAQNRPNTFKGAIGDLTIDSHLDNSRVSVGDPIRLNLTVRGKGNFVAMPAPVPFLGEDFRIGPPAFSFDGEENKLQGSQNFEYILNPLRAGILEVPAITFSYFDPLKEEYISATTHSHKIRVDPGDKWVEPSTLENPSAAQSSEGKNLYRQTESEPGEWINLLATPKPFQSPVFWAIQSLSSMIFLALFTRRLLRRDPQLEGRLKKDKFLDRKIRESLKMKDRSGFHKSLRSRIRLKVGIACKHPNPSALSSSEIVNLLNEKDFPEALVSEVLNLLKICDDLEYAGSAHASSALESTFELSKSVLRKIK